MKDKIIRQLAPATEAWAVYWAYEHREGLSIQKNEMYALRVVVWVVQDDGEETGGGRYDTVVGYTAGESSTLDEAGFTNGFVGYAICRSEKEACAEYAYMLDKEEKDASH